MPVKTDIYSITSMQFINVILHLQLKRFKYFITAFVLLLVILPVIKLHYIYASIILLFGIVPFAIFHLYFSALTRIKISPFAPKYIQIDETLLEVVQTTGEVTAFKLEDIDYITYDSGYYVLSTPDKGLLLVADRAFANVSDRDAFFKLVTRKQYIKK